MATKKTVFIVNGPPGTDIPSAISPNQKLLASTTMETMGVSLALRDTEKGKEIRKLTPLKPLKPFHNAIKTVVFSQDSKRIIALTKEGEGIIWDVQSGKELKRFASAEAMMQELMKLL